MRRRRLICIRPRLAPQAGPVLAAAVEPWIEALRLHALVVVLDSDFDLAAVAAAFRPDMIAFSALDRSRPQPVRIANRHAHPEIPRILVLDGDPYDPMRTPTLAMADHHGIAAIVATSEAHRRQMPDGSPWPVHVVTQFVDAADFRDYGLPKTIPISVFGDTCPQSHDWRVRMVAALDGVLPLLMFPHPGNASGPRGAFGVAGPAYARLINRSAFVLADTTRLDHVARKHLEIPAAGSVLVAPGSAALQRYGFVDGENCLLGDGPSLVEKIAALARDQDHYQQVRQAGHDLVQARYTRETWTALPDWVDNRPTPPAVQKVLDGLSARVERQPDKMYLVPQDIAA